MQQRVIREVSNLGGSVIHMSLDRHAVISDYPSWIPSVLHPLTPSGVNYVVLNGKHIGDEQVAMASELPNIQVLDINFSVITDDAMLELQQCTTLLELHLDAVTTVSDDSIAKFRAARPECEVIR